MSDKPLVVARIPAYDEERTMGGVVVRAWYMDRVVVCDDGSGDLTGAVAGRLGALVVRHEWNMGHVSRGCLFSARSEGLMF